MSITVSYLINHRLSLTEYVGTQAFSLTLGSDLSHSLHTTFLPTPPPPAPPSITPLADDPLPSHDGQVGSGLPVTDTYHLLLVVLHIELTGVGQAPWILCLASSYEHLLKGGGAGKPRVLILTGCPQEEVGHRIRGPHLTPVSLIC